MGTRYVLFRAFYEFKKRTGILKLVFPGKFVVHSFLDLSEWKSNQVFRLFQNRNRIHFDLSADDAKSLEKKVNNILNGKICFFSGEILDLGVDYDWITNPLTGYRYDINTHWSKLNDFDERAGDIKYVWEKSRFCYLYDVIRYDNFFNKDNSEFVLNEILDWIEKNPVNYGPNYICSQEISLRILNWMFALDFYRDSESLTQERFNIILSSIYYQVRHVYSNINFSRIAVRNNHAITETMLLMLIKFIFPFFDESNKWSKKGKQWFEKEILYQIYPDGSYLQFSMNYHRVVVQLLTWAMIITRNHKEELSEKIRNRANQTLKFLLTCQDISGRMPNYGSNDGALFFPFNSNGYSDFRPQLQALAFALGFNVYYSQFEDVHWYGISPGEKEISIDKGQHVFNSEGFYVCRDTDSMLFIPNCIYKNRPAQDDSLHFDLWYKGENYFIDSGSYRYNMEKGELSNFIGAIGHNHLTLEEENYMEKKGRFMWLNWSKRERLDATESKSGYSFNGVTRAIISGQEVKFSRIISHKKDTLTWEITDTVVYDGDNESVLRWKVNPAIKDKLKIVVKDETGYIEPELNIVPFSLTYGVKQDAIQYEYHSNQRKLYTTITILG